MLTSDSPYTPISGLYDNPVFVHIMNVHEGLKDGPQPAFNLSILIQWYQLMHNWLLACCPSLFHKSKSVKITWGYFSDYGIYT